VIVASSAKTFNRRPLDEAHAALPVSWQSNASFGSPHADIERCNESHKRRAEESGGNLVAHIRMDGAWLGSIDISIKKAFTARAFDIATRDLAPLAQPGADFYGINTSNQGRIMIFAGGIPLRRGAEVVGAIGVSGGSGEQDQAVAEAGAAAFG
jgi:uncharacterized protein GlcG (DUF336 family)